MEQAQYEYRQAQYADVPQLIDLINSQAIHDREKIVILPKIFREKALVSAIMKNRIFVAQDQGNIIGYKKLFIATDPAEKREIMQDEIRCLGNEEGNTFAGCINSEGAFVYDGSRMPADFDKVCIYTGGDFTSPDYRGKGINQQLTQSALLSLMAPIKQQIHEQKAKTVTMLYGITQANAGEYPGAPSDRTPGISKLFKSFIQSLENHHDSIVLQHQRYRSFMPTFDPESQVLQPLPDDQSIPGFGCVLTYQLRESHE